ncbi:GDSL esterase/lipase At4g10955-like [Typha latifolia]|uniref:GDSL esterase/lipase At4g10955-like n=1 Tax=Typha latifolia TaxID=4733 RepID=UPI003C2BA3FB
MPSQKDVFEVSGPFGLTFVKWNDPHHQRCVVASLVQGAYVLERDRQKRREGSEARAPPWWKSFHFEQIKKLVDDKDGSIFGAIYEFKPSGSIVDPSAPKYVIAFRGTLLKLKSIKQDIALDFKLVMHKLEEESRSIIATQAVADLVSAHGDEKIWLAGHSLGSALATLAGKSMARKGVNLKAFLFNPPFVSAPIDLIKNEKVKKGIRIMSSFIKAGVAKIVKNHQDKSSESFAMARSWTPNLFVNTADHVSSQYIGYFEHRKTMAEIGAGTVEKVATQNSFTNLLVYDSESEPFHLLPSAILTENLCPSSEFDLAHGIQQWWTQGLTLQSSHYRYDELE